MSAAQFRSGMLWGLPLVKFTLIYDGPLPSAGGGGKNADKWRIRKDLHPQFIELWARNSALNQVYENRHFPKYGGASLKMVHHEHPGPVSPNLIADDGSEPPLGRQILDLCEPINVHGVNFRPLVRNSYALHCGLKILFLRREPPGKVYQGGDIDGRMKTLLDALAMPQHKEQVLRDDNAPNPIFCLLEDDSLISGLTVETERLLTPENQAADYVRLTIEVDVRVRQTTVYNQSFLG